MAKKNKKNVKINQKIRTYFDDDPFDVGVQRVDTATLSELFHVLGIYDVDYSKEVMVKSIRMLWSNSDTDFRREVLDFFVANGTIYQSDNPKKSAVERVDKIHEIIEELSANAEEEAILFDMFSGMRSKKITIEKMESKLKHIRFDAKKKMLEKELDGVFDIDDSLEFNADILYEIFEQRFHKILTLNTKPYEYEYLQNTSIEELINEIQKDKQNTILVKQNNVEKFLLAIQDPHPYLSRSEILSTLKSASPKNLLEYPVLKASIIKRIVKGSLKIIDVVMHSQEALLIVKEYITLPYSSHKIAYELEIHIELNELLQSIWKAESLDFSIVLQEAKNEHENSFLQTLNDLVQECGSYASLLHFTQEELHEKVYEYLMGLIPKTLVISSKVARKTMRIFIFNMQEQLIKKQKHALLARTIRDFKNLFPIAREMKRKLVLHIGPTNSGKTYDAMQQLMRADTGYYLAPLRLLALEGYEGLQEEGIKSSLITGEEQIVDDSATHISSTIEMLNFEVDVDVCVIDEVQMIDDRDRGWAWANAIIGAPAKEIIMTGSPNAKEAVIALAQYLGEELEIKEHERKNPLQVLEVATKIDHVQEGSAIIAFTRKDVLRLKQIFSKFFSVSVIYGNLSPEVRREEAKRFRQGDTQILIATDAIAMGMNLPIKTILFSKAEKFDGVVQRKLFASEIHQIAGRAGRFGLIEEGYVGALNEETLKVVKKNFYKEAKTIAIPFKVMANLEHIKLVGTILEESSLEEILKFFYENMEFNGPFHATNIEDMLLASEIVDHYDLDIATKYHLACAPLTLKSNYILGAYENYIRALEQKIPVRYDAPVLYGTHAQTTDELLRAEDMVKEISLYLWLSYRFGDYFIDADKARKNRGVLNKYIEESLHQNYFTQTCNICKKPLPLNTKYSICQACFKKNYVNVRGKSRRRSA